MDLPDWAETALIHARSTARPWLSVARARASCPRLPIDLIGSSWAAEQQTRHIEERLNTIGYNTTDSSGRRRHLAILPSEVLGDRRTIVRDVISLIQHHPKGKFTRMWVITGGVPVPIGNIRAEMQRLSSITSDWAAHVRARSDIDVLLAKTEIALSPAGAHVHIHLILIPNRLLPADERDAPLQSLRAALGGCHVEDCGRLGAALPDRGWEPAAKAAMAAAYLAKYITDMDEILALSDADLLTYVQQIEGMRVLRPMGILRPWRARAAALGISWIAIGNRIVALQPTPARTQAPDAEADDLGGTPRPREPFCKVIRSYRRVDDHVVPCIVLVGRGRTCPGPRTQAWITKGKEWITRERIRLRLDAVPDEVQVLLADEQGTAPFGTNPNYVHCTTPAPPGAGHPRPSMGGGQGSPEYDPPPFRFFLGEDPFKPLSTTPVP